jgi:hypothetical protein
VTNREDLKVAMDLSVVITLVVIHMLAELFIREINISNAIPFHLFLINSWLTFTIREMAH